MNRFVIQISSPAALQPFYGMGLYSSSKACMDMFIRNLATDQPKLRVLNYAPGSMDTQMARDVWTKTKNEECKEYLTSLFTEGTIINTLDSVKKLLNLIRDNEF